MKKYYEVETKALCALETNVQGIFFFTVLFEVTDVMCFGGFLISVGYRLCSESVVSYLIACVNDEHEQKRIF